MLFFLWLCVFLLSGVISPLFSSSIWAPTDLGSSSFSSYPFAFHTVMAFSRQECWSGLPFLSPVDLILSELSTMTHPSWVALHGMAHSFTELDNTVVHVIKLVIFLWLWCQSVCPLMPSPSAYHLNGIPLTLDMGYVLRPLVLTWMWGTSSQPLATPELWGCCSPYKETNPTVETPCLWLHLNLITSSKSYLQIPSL